MILLAAGLIILLLACLLVRAHMKWRFAEAKLQLVQKSEEQLKAEFMTVSSEVMERSQNQFLHLAKATFETYQQGTKGDLDKKQLQMEQMLTPFKQTLDKLERGIKELETERKSDHHVLRTQVHALVEAEKELRKETSNLVKALRTPAARGRWGEMQLRRVVELAGMLNHCDFFEQSVQEGEAGRSRPDLIVKLPGERQVVIDAKVPLEAYLEAIQESDESRRQTLLQSHARQVRAHILQLGKKAYHEQFEPTPEFVVLFLPAETFFSVALEHDPSLIELGADQKVILATPTTLIALLRAVAYGWKQENLSKYVQEVSALGAELHKRLIAFSGHFGKMGQSIATSVDHFNKMVGSFESRVLVTARRLQEVDTTSAQLESVSPIEKTPLLLDN